MTPETITLLTYIAIGISLLLSIISIIAVFTNAGPAGPTGPVGPVGPAGKSGVMGPTGPIYSNNKEVFTDLIVGSIDASGKLVNASAAIPGTLITDSSGVTTLTPLSVQKGGRVSLIAITATLDPSTTSYTTGSTWQFFMGKNGDFSIMPSGNQSTLYFEGNNNQPKTFYFYPGQNGFPTNIILQPGSTITIKGIGLSGILKDISIGILYDMPPKFWL
jgi:hypothetical protein